MILASMDGEDTTTRLTPRDEDDEDEFGTRFWLKMAGIVAGIGILALIGLLIFWRAVYAWGFFGALLALAVVLLIWAWVHDRRHPHSTLG